MCARAFLFSALNGWSVKRRPEADPIVFFSFVSRPSIDLFGSGSSFGLFCFKQRKSVAKRREENRMSQPTWTKVNRDISRECVCMPINGARWPLNTAYERQRFALRTIRLKNVMREKWASIERLFMGDVCPACCQSNSFPDGRGAVFYLEGYRFLLLARIDKRKSAVKRGPFKLRSVQLTTAEGFNWTRARLLRASVVYCLFAARALVLGPQHFLSYFQLKIFGASFYEALLVKTGRVVSRVVALVFSRENRDATASVPAGDPCGRQSL